jgi:hypothetical protein
VFRSVVTPCALQVYVQSKSGFQIYGVVVSLLNAAGKPLSSPRKIYRIVNCQPSWMQPYLTSMVGSETG